MQYYSGENNCENIGGDMLRGGITLALFSRLVILVVRVLRWHPDWLIYRCIKTPERQQSINTQAKQVQCTNTWWHDILMHWNLTNKLNGVQNNYFDKRRWSPIFNLMFYLLPTKVQYYKCVQTCMEMMLMDGPYYSEHFDILNTFFSDSPNKSYCIYNSLLNLPLC